MTTVIAIMEKAAKDCAEIMKKAEADVKALEASRRGKKALVVYEIVVVDGDEDFKPKKFTSFPKLVQYAYKENNRPPRPTVKSSSDEDESDLEPDDEDMDDDIWCFMLCRKSDLTSGTDTEFWFKITRVADSDEPNLILGYCFMDASDGDCYDATYVEFGLDDIPSL